MNIMRIIKIALIPVGLYVCVVVLFELGLGVYQPTWKGTVELTTTDDEGVTHQRVLSALYFEGALYVRANHWPRDWYRDALARPQVVVHRKNKQSARLAVPVTGEEEKRVNAKHRILLRWRILTGFPPLRLLRLDPVKAAE